MYLDLGVPPLTSRPSVRSQSSLMRQDSQLFRQLFSLHESIAALKHGVGSLSGGSSLSSLADIEEEDTISNPSTDLDRQSHLSSEADNLSVSEPTMDVKSFGCIRRVSHVL